MKRHPATKTAKSPHLGGLSTLRSDFRHQLSGALACIITVTPRWPVLPPLITALRTGPCMLGPRLAGASMLLRCRSFMQPHLWGTWPAVRAQHRRAWLRRKHGLMRSWRLYMRAVWWRRRWCGAMARRHPVPRSPVIAAARPEPAPCLPDMPGRRCAVAVIHTRRWRVAIGGVDGRAAVATVYRWHHTAAEQGRAPRQATTAAQRIQRLLGKAIDCGMVAPCSWAGAARTCT